MDMSADWEGIINRMIELPCNNSINSIVRRLVLVASMYYIWVERNKRQFTVEKRSNKEILKATIDNVRQKLASFRVKGSTQVAKVSKEWQVQMNKKRQDIWDEEMK